MHRQVRPQAEAAGGWSREIKCLISQDMSPGVETILIQLPACLLVERPVLRPHDEIVGVQAAEKSPSAKCRSACLRMLSRTPLVLQSWDTCRGAAHSERLRLNVSSHETMQATQPISGSRSPAEAHVKYPHTCACPSAHWLGFDGGGAVRWNVKHGPRTRPFVGDNTSLPRGGRDGAVNRSSITPHAHHWTTTGTHRRRGYRYRRVTPLRVRDC